MRPNIWAEEIELAGLTGSTFRLRLPERTVTVKLGLPGVYNIYNALAAATVGYALGARAEEIVSGLESTQAAFGPLGADRDRRAEAAAAPDQEPDRSQRGRAHARRGRHAENARDRAQRRDRRRAGYVLDLGRRLRALLGGLERLIASGGRAAELALRFKYAGFPEDRIEVVPSPAEALDRGLELTDEKGELIVCPTYTAMLELQDVLVARGHADPYWQRAARAREESGEARKPR